MRRLIAWLVFVPLQILWLPLSLLDTFWPALRARPSWGEGLDAVRSASVVRHSPIARHLSK